MKRHKPIKRKYNWWQSKDSTKLQLWFLENTRWIPHCAIKYLSTMWLDYDVNFPFGWFSFVLPFFLCYKWSGHVIGYSSLVCLFNKNCIRVSIRRPLYFHFHFWWMKLSVKFNLAYLCPSVKPLKVLKSYPQIPNSTFSTAIFFDLLPIG